MNILILSVGTRNKIIQYFKKELENKGVVVATDASLLAPALYEADFYYEVPLITDDNYLNIIFDICKKHNINAVLSLIDPELNILSKNEKLFLDNGITPIISCEDLVELSFDKFKFFNKLKEHNIPTVLTYDSIINFKKDFEDSKIAFPVFVKPKNGSASININKVKKMDELEMLFLKHENLIIQEFIKGKEFGADVYIDMISGEVISIFVKEKVLMRSGETDKSKSVVIPEINKLVERLIKVLPFKGVIDIDIFENDGEYLISEVNPRFGGGYPHAYECGINFPMMIVNNLKNNINKKTRNYKENIYMMKYNEVKIIEGNIK